ncbi:MAG: CHAT domain-containing protein, partial [Phycisphaerae bacterium]|nr:CHAT domain-containing protein [Phycisphaerae bacterium]
ADDAPPAAGGAGGEGERTLGAGPGERAVEVPEFSPLPDTGRFLETIRPWLEQRGFAVETRTGEAATEEAAQGAAGARLVQFATHGYFTGGTGELRAAGAGVSGYVRSMLILAGANRRDQPRVWVRAGDALLTPAEAAARGLSAEQIAAGRTEVSNGLLTALEVLGMDLSGTELVGLTACETGLGETTAGEGVIGLRRAFLLAGARSVVMSLWEVPLAETMALHERFYRGWLGEGAGRFEAFAAARAAALAGARAERNGAGHPFYWAGFIYAGDPGDAPPAPPAR